MKVKIEAQGRFLESIAEEYKHRPNAKSSKSLFSSPTSLPSLCDDSESNTKETDSDSDVDKNEIRSDERFRAPKRLRVDENDIYIAERYNKHASMGSESCAQQRIMLKGSKISYQSPEIGFPWTAAAYCQSPLLPASSYGTCD